MANKNWFSILDIVGAVNEQEDHEKNRNYWKYLKAKLKKENSELVSATTQLKLTASDGKKYKTDVISQAGVEQLAKSIRNQRARMKQVPRYLFHQSGFLPEPVAKIINNKELRKKMEEKLGR